MQYRAANADSNRENRASGFKLQGCSMIDAYRRKAAAYSTADTHKRRQCRYVPLHIWQGKIHCPCGYHRKRVDCYSGRKRTRNNFCLLLPLRGMGRFVLLRHCSCWTWFQLVVCDFYSVSHTTNKPLQFLWPTVRQSTVAKRGWCQTN